MAWQEAGALAQAAVLQMFPGRYGHRVAVCRQANDHTHAICANAEQKVEHWPCASHKPRESPHDAHPYGVAASVKQRAGCRGGKRWGRGGRAPVRRRPVSQEQPSLGSAGWATAKPATEVDARCRRRARSPEWIRSPADGPGRRHRGHLEGRIGEWILHSRSGPDAHQDPQCLELRDRGVLLDGGDAGGPLQHAAISQLKALGVLVRIGA